MPLFSQSGRKDQRFLFEQRVAAGEQEEVEVARSASDWQTCHSLMPPPKA